MLFHFAIQILIVLSFNSSICLRSQKQTTQRKNPKTKQKLKLLLVKRKTRIYLTSNLKTIDFMHLSLSDQTPPAFNLYLK